MPRYNVLVVYGGYVTVDALDEEDAVDRAIDQAENNWAFFDAEPIYEECYARQVDGRYALTFSRNARSGVPCCSRDVKDGVYAERRAKVVGLFKGNQ